MNKRPAFTLGGIFTGTVILFEMDKTISLTSTLAKKRGGSRMGFWIKGRETYADIVLSADLSMLGTRT